MAPTTRDHGRFDLRKNQFTDHFTAMELYNLFNSTIA